MWIARDDNGDLNCFRNKPVKRGGTWEDDSGGSFSLDSRLFPEVGGEPRIFTMYLNGMGFKFKRKKVVKINEDGSREVYSSISAAALDNGVNFSEVSRFCNGTKYSFNRKKLPFRFEFQNDVENDKENSGI